jgi:hypothetical protein
MAQALTFSATEPLGVEANQEFLRLGRSPFDERQGCPNLAPTAFEAPSGEKEEVMHAMPSGQEIL